MIISEDELKTIILKTKIVDDKKLAELLELAKDSNATLFDILIDKSLLTDENLGLLIADFLKVPFIVLSKISIPEEVYRLIPEKIARRYKIIPFARDSQGLKIAMADPKNTEIFTVIQKKTGGTLVPYYAT